MSQFKKAIESARFLPSICRQVLSTGSAWFFMSCIIMWTDFVDRLAAEWDRSWCQFVEIFWICCQFVNILLTFCLIT